MRTNHIRSVGYFRTGDRPALFTFLHDEGKDRDYQPKPQSLARLNQLIRRGDLQFCPSSMAVFLGTNLTTVWFDVVEHVVTNQYTQLFQDSQHVTLRPWSEDEFFGVLTDEDDEIGEW